jgi:hypothetical protein
MNHIEEKIIEIMDREGHEIITQTQNMTIYWDRYDSAREIASMFDQFMSWVSDEGFQYHSRFKIWVWSNQIGLIRKTTDELFEQWNNTK